MDIRGLLSSPDIIGRFQVTSSLARFQKGLGSVLILSNSSIPPRLRIIDGSNRAVSSDKGHPPCSESDGHVWFHCTLMFAGDEPY